MDRGSDPTTMEDGIPKVVNEGYNYLGHSPNEEREKDWLGDFLHG